MGDFSMANLSLPKAISPVQLPVRRPGLHAGGNGKVESLKAAVGWRQAPFL